MQILPVSERRCLQQLAGVIRVKSDGISHRSGCRLLVMWWQLEPLKCPCPYCDAFDEPTGVDGLSMVRRSYWCDDELPLRTLKFVSDAKLTCPRSLCQML